MGNEQVIIFGLGVVSVLFAYFGLSFIEKEEMFSQLMGKIFFMASMLFIMLLVNTIYLILLNDVGLLYLRSSTAVGIVTVFYYLLMIGLGVYFVWLIWGIIVLFSRAVQEAMGSKRKSKTME